MIDVGFVGLGHNAVAHIEVHLRLGRSRGAPCATATRPGWRKRENASA